MAYIKNQERLRFALVCAALALWTCACSALSAVDPAGPRPNAPPYPILFTEEESRREATLTAWSALTRSQGIQNAPAPELQPVTATIRALPLNLSTPLYMPKVGEELPMTENETRESLRRFIASASLLIGADPRQLSLVQRTDLADGTKRARYEQRPFRYPLRNGYGLFEITFAPNGRILQMTSTCIPEVERLQRAGAGTRPSPDLTPEKIATRVVGLTFTYTDAAGQPQSYTIAKTDQLTVSELVVFPRPRANDPAVLEFHLAWEIAVGSDPERKLYLDAVTGETL